jgi:hypothetical protein
MAIDLLHHDHINLISAVLFLVGDGINHPLSGPFCHNKKPMQSYDFMAGGQIVPKKCLCDRIEKDGWDRHHLPANIYGFSGGEKKHQFFSCHHGTKHRMC